MNQLSIEPWLEAISMRPRSRVLRLVRRPTWEVGWPASAQPLSYNAL